MNPVLRKLGDLGRRLGGTFEELAVLDDFVLQTLPQLPVALAIFFAFRLREALASHVSVQGLDRSRENPHPSWVRCRWIYRF